MIENISKDQDFKRGLYTVGTWLGAGMLSTLYILFGWLLYVMGAPVGVYNVLPAIAILTTGIAAVAATAYLSDIEFEEAPEKSYRED